jgi:ketosteroid isomerase-like protein
VLVTDRASQLAELFEVFARDGIDAVLAFFDPGVHWASPPDWMDQSGYDGYEGLRLLEGQWRANFDEYGLTASEVRRVADDRYVVLLHQHGRIKGTGDYIRQEVGWVVDFNDAGLVSLVRAYFSWDETLQAAESLRGPG